MADNPADMDSRKTTSMLAAVNSDPAIFLSKLSMEIALGDIRLPSFPDIAARIQKVL